MTVNSLGRALVVLLGPPGCGKSTLAATILDSYPELAHFAVRRQFLEEKRRQSDLWMAAADSQEKGQWIPDNVVIEAFTRRLEQSPQGMLVEGLPANGPQAYMVLDAVADRRLKVDRVIYLDAPDEVCMSRMRGRWVCTTCDGGISQAPLSTDTPGRCARCGTPLTRRQGDEDVPFADRLRLHRLYISDILEAFGAGGNVAFIDARGTQERVADAALRCLEP